MCSKCGSSNHLAMQCKNIVLPAFSQSIPVNVDQNFSGFPQMFFLPNPYFLYGTPIVNNPFAYTYPENDKKSYSQSKASIKTKGQRPAPKVKVDLTSSEPKVEK